MDTFTGLYIMCTDHLGLFIVNNNKYLSFFIALVSIFRRLGVKNIISIQEMSNYERTNVT